MVVYRSLFSCLSGYFIFGHGRIGFVGTLKNKGQDYHVVECTPITFAQVRIPVAPQATDGSTFLGIDFGSIYSLPGFIRPVFSIAIESASSYLRL